VSCPISFDVSKAEIRTSIAPDHKSVFLGVEIKSEFKRGPGLWKFNNTLLEDENYKELIMDVLLSANCRKTLGSNR